MSPSIFDVQDCKNLINRLNQLSPDTKGQWGKMTVDQMLAHLNVAFDLTFDQGKKGPGFIKKMLLKLVVKPAVVGTKPYKKNGPTAPEFVIKNVRDFDLEKAKLISNINKVLEIGQAGFEGRAYINFGKLTAAEWNNLFYKHINHHLTQFGV